MTYTLLVSEKPDAMRRIAEALADPKTLKKLENNGVTYYEFMRNRKKHIIVSAVGHLFNLSPIRERKGWYYPIFDSQWEPSFQVRKDAAFSKRYFKLIEKIGKTASDYIVCTDFDTEGSVIGYNILRFLCGVNDGKRMKFSTLTNDELTESYSSMSNHLDFSQIETGLTRHNLDWLYGLNLSTALTLALKSANPKGFTVLSTGRVQGPALEMLMGRELEIRKFEPVPFWQLELHVKLNGTEAIAIFEKEKIWDKDEGEKVFNACKDKDAIVKDVKKRAHKQNPPPPFNTTDLQSESYSQFGFSPTQTLSIAESLYQAGYISYPRSSSQKLPPSINYQKILKAIGKLSPYQKFVQKLFKKSLRPVEGPRDDPAHPAVYATHETPNLSKLNAQQKKIYDMVVRRTLATFGDDAVREASMVYLDVNGNGFVLNGIKTLQPGWIEIYSPYLSRDEVVLPELKIGQKLEVMKLEMLSKETQPPSRYSQGSIVKELEKRNLGTKATRAEILQTLYDRGYIIGKSIQVTKLGEAVTLALKEYSPKIVSEELTKHFDDEMEQVYSGGKKRQDVVDEAKHVLTDILEEFKRNEKEIGKRLLEGLVQARDDASRLGTCPKCGNELRIIRARTGKYFVGCKGYPNCKNAYPLPGMAKIQALNKVCGKCGTPMIQVIRRARRAFRMCLDPNCPTKADWGRKK